MKDTDADNIEDGIGKDRGKNQDFAETPDFVIKQEDIGDSTNERTEEMEEEHRTDNHFEIIAASHRANRGEESDDNNKGQHRSASPNEEKDCGLVADFGFFDH